MAVVLQQAQSRYGSPTPEDLERAEQQYASDLAGKKEWLRSKMLHCFAMGYVASRALEAQKAQQVIPAETPEERNAKLIVHDWEACSIILPASRWIERDDYGQLSAGASLRDQTIRATQVVEYLRRVFPYKPKNNLLLIGNPGSGKTFGALAYLAQCTKLWEENHKTVCDSVFITAYNLIELHTRNKADEIDRLKAIKNLLIDDLGAESNKRYGESTIAFFDAFFADRHLYNRPTIITSNGTLEGIRAAYGERFVSRFQESGEVFETKDPDFRIHKEV